MEKRTHLKIQYDQKAQKRHFIFSPFNFTTEQLLLIYLNAYILKNNRLFMIKLFLLLLLISFIACRFLTGQSCMDNNE